MAFQDHQQDNQSSRQASERSLDLFEDRYGAGSFIQVVAMLGQPCVTFAQIAQRFGVSRERVRQWQLKFLPDAPRGHKRRRLCLIENSRRQLLADPLFRAFYRDARVHFHRSEVLPVSGGSGFRKRMVRLNGRIVAIKNARSIPRGHRSGGPSYALTNAVVPVDFIYYHLEDAGYLVVPRDLIPSTGTTFLDSATSRYQPYRNTFAAVQAVSPGQRQAVEIGNGHPGLSCE